MKQYKGYYIDHFYFNSEAEIDEYIKSKEIARFIFLTKYLYNHMIIEASILHTKQADRLRRFYGMTPSELEDLEIATITNMN